MNLTPTQKTIIRLMREGWFVKIERGEKSIAIRQSVFGDIKYCPTEAFRALEAIELIKETTPLPYYDLTEKGRTINID